MSDYSQSKRLLARLLVCLGDCRAVRCVRGRGRGCVAAWLRGCVAGLGLTTVTVHAAASAISSLEANDGDAAVTPRTPSNSTIPHHMSTSCPSVHTESLVDRSIVGQTNLNDPS